MSPRNNKKSLSILGALCSLFFLSPAFGESPSLEIRCATDLVGDPSRFSIGHKPESPFFTSELNQALEKYTLAEEHFAETLTVQFENLKKTALGQPLSNEVRNLYLYFLVGDKIENEEIVNSTTRKINRIRWKTFFPALTPQEVSVLGDFGDSIMESYTTKDELTPRNDARFKNFSFLINFLLSKQKNKNILALGTEILAKERNIIQTYGSTSSDLQILPLLEKMQRGETLTPFEQNFFVDTYINHILLLEDTLDPKYRAISERINIPLEKILNELHLDENITRISSLLKQGELKTEIQDKTLKFCRDGISYALDAAPTSEQLQVSRELLERIQKKALETFPLYVSDTSGTIKSVLEQIQFSLPSSLSDTESEIIESLKKSTSDLNRETQLLLEGGPETIQNQLLRIIIKIIQSRSFSPSSLYFASLKSSCTRIKDSRSSDLMDAYIGKSVYVGWQSVFFPKSSVGVIAHELGHAVKMNAPKDAIKTVLNNALLCARSNHDAIHEYPRSKDPKENAKNQKRFDEEDWADIFSISVTRRLGQDGVLFENYLDDLVIDDLRSSQSALFLNLLNLIPEDPHSSDLLREILYSAQTKKNLPKSCERLVATQIPGAKKLNQCAL